MSVSEDQKSKVLKKRGKASRLGGCLRFFFYLILLALLVAGGLSAYNYYTKMPEVVGRFKDTIMSKVDAGNTKPAKLYFAHPQWTRLVAEDVPMPVETDKTRKAQRLIEYLARGPQSEAGAVLPRNAKLKQAYLGANGLLVIDFEPNLGELRSYGASSELLTVYAVVQTLVDNIEGIQRVRILVDGKEQETLAGHVTITEPLTPRTDLLGGQR